MMAPINVDETMSETESGASGAQQAVETASQSPTEAAGTPEFDATPWPVPPRPAPRPLKISRPLGPRLWTATLAAALLFTAGGFVLLYLDDTTFQRNAGQLNNNNQSLKSQNKALQAQLLTTQTNLTATLGELATVRAELEHPDLTIWNVPQDIKDANWYLAGGAPDTFTYHLRATSSGPMTISILTLEDFAKAMACVTNGYGTTNYCMHHSGTPTQTFTNVTTVNYDFHGAEGCADYVVVFTAASHVTVTPNVSVTYNPASKSTGACA
jgi:hypothetical protein